MSWRFNTLARIIVDHFKWYNDYMVLWEAAKSDPSVAVYHGLRFVAFRLK